MYIMSIVWRSDVSPFAHRVYAVPTFESCQRLALASDAVPRIEAATVRAADSAPVRAR